MWVVPPPHDTCDSTASSWKGLYNRTWCSSLTCLHTHILKEEKTKRLKLSSLGFFFARLKIAFRVHLNQNSSSITVDCIFAEQVQNYIWLC